MPSKSFTCVEDTNSDNGYDSYSAFFRFGVTRVSSVQDMVDKVLAELQPGECISELTIIGHGSPGSISVGNGQSGTDPQREINGGNEAVWGPQLDRLRCRFCQDGYIFLRGCNVGADNAGARKLFRIMGHITCATIKAKTGVVNALWTTGDDVFSRPGETAPPPAVPNPDRGKKKKWGEGGIVSSIGTGADMNSLEWLDPIQVVEARFLPRILGRNFALDALDSDAVPLPADAIDILRRSFEESDTFWLPAHGFSLDGYLQLKIVPPDQSAEPAWITAGAVIGGYTYYSALREDTSLVYGVSPELADVLQTLRDDFNNPNIA